jgi:N-acetylneuraminic acid mutarotase
LGSTEIYDPVTGVWTQTGSLNVHRAGLTLNRLSNGRVLAIGGEDMTFQVLNSIEQYNPATQKWTLLKPTLANARAAHTTTTLLDGRLLVAGGADNNGSIPNAELVATAH